MFRANCIRQHTALHNPQYTHVCYYGCTVHTGHTYQLHVRPLLTEAGASLTLPSMYLAAKYSEDAPAMRGGWPAAGDFDR
jgi:hypothetical protein